MDAVRIVYVSSAVEPMDSAQLAALAEVSADRNRRAGVTGLLLYHDGCFIQALEGPTKAVDATLRRIERDPRHRGVLVLLREPMGERQFEEWDLAYIHSDNVAAQDRERIQDALAEGAGQRSRAKTLLKSFARGIH